MHNFLTKKKKTLKTKPFLINMEQNTGVGPAYPPWEGGILPMNQFCTTITIIMMSFEKTSFLILCNFLFLISRNIIIEVVEVTYEKIIELHCK